MTPKEKARELFDKYQLAGSQWYVDTTKNYALIAVENEFNSLRELLFSLRSSRVIESEKIYLSRLDQLDKLEQEVKQEIEKL